MNVLIVEDNKPVGLVLARVVRELGLGALMASDGDSALRMYRQRDVHLILMDIQLPSLDGFSVTREIRNLAGPTLPVILISGNSGDAWQQQALDAGANEFLEKPIRPGELSALLRRYLPLAAQDTDS